MFWSIAPLVIGLHRAGGDARHVLVRADGPGKGPAPSYDAPAALQADADALKIPIRLPKLPDGWQANSGSRGGIDGGRTDPSTGQPARAVTSTVGYLAPSGMYLSLTQSNADEDKLVGSINTDLYPTGTQDVDGVKWVVYEGGGQNGKRPSRCGPPGSTARPGRRRSRSPAPQVRTSTVRWRRRRRPQPPLPAQVEDGDRMTAPEADLTGWTVEPFTAAGYTHDVYRKGEGPGVVLIPEMPGIHPGVLGSG